MSPDSIAEDDGPTTFTITATLEGEGTLDSDTIVTISLAGTATEDTDYTVTTALASITVPSGQSSGSGTLTLSPSEDEIIEEPESILITGASSGLGNDSAAITLTDATDGEGEVVMAYLGIASPSKETPEGSYARFTLNLSQAVTADLTVSYKVIPGTADPSDYVEQSGVVTFVAHSPTDLTETITITINEDLLSEGTETFTVVLQDVSGDQASRVQIDTARASARGTIAESDPITVNLHGPQFVDEGDSATYTVSLSPFGVIPTENLNLEFDTIDGTAIGGSDYIVSSGSLLFSQAAPGLQTFVIRTIEDATHENDKSFLVVIWDSEENVKGQVLALVQGGQTRGSAPAPRPNVYKISTTIRDDDSPSTPEVSPPSIPSDDPTSPPLNDPAPTPPSEPPREDVPPSTPTPPSEPPAENVPPSTPALPYKPTEEPPLTTSTIESSSVTTPDTSSSITPGTSSNSTVEASDTPIASAASTTTAETTSASVPGDGTPTASGNGVSSTPETSVASVPGTSSMPTNTPTSGESAPSTPEDDAPPEDPSSPEAERDTPMSWISSSTWLLLLLAILIFILIVLTRKLLRRALRRAIGRR